MQSSESDHGGDFNSDWRPQLGIQCLIIIYLYADPLKQIVGGTSIRSDQGPYMLYPFRYYTGI